MFIVWDKSAIEKLQQNYTVLELETFQKEDKQITAYCVISEVSVAELTTLETSKQLHNSFINEFKKGNFSFCSDAIPFLKGKFNGELDSFYDNILNRISKINM
jgi:hypothetical protein